MGSLIFQIILITVAICININSEIRDGINGGTKKQILEKKQWHRKLSIRLLIFTFCFSVAGQILDWHSKKEDRKKQKENYDYSIAKLDTSINKGNNALVFLNGVKTSTKLILDSVKRQLDLQSNTILVQKDLLRKNEALVAAQHQIFKNTDAALNPFFPVTMFLDLIIVNNNERTNALKRYMYELKSKLKNKSTLTFNDNTNESIFSTQHYDEFYDQLSIINNDSLIENNQIIQELIHCDYKITFTDKSLQEYLNRKSAFIPLPKYSFSVQRGRSSAVFSAIKYDFKNDELHFNLTHYGLMPSNIQATKNISFDILKNLYIKLEIGTFSNLKINYLTLRTETGVTRSLRFSNTWDEYPMTSQQFFSHKISDKNIFIK